MIKGKSKIELFNAKTGAKQWEEINTNMVTNALSKILNMDDSLGFMRFARGTADYNTINPLLQAMPLATKALGGVYLFGDNITEDANITIPPEDNPCLGYAGSAYSGDDIYRGTYNSNESGAIADTNGYTIGRRHVWDFGTDKGNGEIKCLGLTSQYGGDYGLNGNASGCAYFPFNSGYFGEGCEYITMKHGCSCLDFKTSVPMVAFYAVPENDGTITMYAKGLNANKLYKLTLEPTKTVLLAKAQCATKNEQAIVDDIGVIGCDASIYVYENRIHVVYRSADKTLTHKTYSFNGALQNTVTVATPSSITYSSNYCATPFFFWNGYYYYKENGGNHQLKKCTAAGEVVADIFTNNMNASNEKGESSIAIGKHGQIEALYSGAGGSTGWMNKNFGEVFKNDTAGISANGNYYQHNNTTEYYYGSPTILTTPAREPFSYIGICANNTTTRIQPYIDMRYLATINNLATPVTKTSAQVMKITYEITETTNVIQESYSAGGKAAIRGGTISTEHLLATNDE